MNKLKKIFNICSQKDITFYDYDKTWKRLLRYAKLHKDKQLFHGAFVDYDDTPRRGRNKARLFNGSTPEKFERYLGELVSISANQNKDYIFLTAWNEWGEGAYLEPDTFNKMKYLKAISNVMGKI